MRIATSTEAADWIPQRLHPFALDVCSFIPDGFESYARILHPLSKRTPDGKVLAVTWREIAAANGRGVGEEILLVDIGSDPGQFSPSGEVLWNEQSRSGSISREIAERLIQALASHTRTPDRCCFAVWEGWGALPNSVRAASTFSVPGRELHLFEGPLTDALKSFDSVDWCFQSANLWWPEDRTWCVSTEIDFKWTYVGGSQECIAEVLNDPLLEALLVSPTTVR